MADDTLGMVYEMRRKARGAEPERKSSRWKHSLLISGIALFMIVCAVIALWVYWSVTYVSTIRAEVRGGVVVLSPDFDARLAELKTEERQHVTAGQELACFDDSERRAALTAAEAGVTLKENQCEAASIRVESAGAALELAEVRGVEEIRRAEANKKSSEAWLNRLRSGAREEEIEAAEARLASAQALAALYGLQLKQSERLFEKQIESEFDLEIMKTQLATQKNVVREAELEVKKLKAGPRVEVIEEAVQVVNARTAELALARASWNSLRRLELELASRKAQLRQAKAELEQAEANVLMGRAALEKMVIKSPVTGTVVRVFFSVGEVVRKGEPTLEVADDSKGRWVEGFVAEEDADAIRQGQKAEVEIGIDSGYYVDGVVERVGYSASANSSRLRSFSEALDYGRPAPIWLRIGIPETDPRPRPGTSAHVLIRVR